MRLIHITMTMVAQSEKVVSANAEAVKSHTTEKRIKNFLHFLIEVIGYFAAASERAKVSFFKLLDFNFSFLMALKF